MMGSKCGWGLVLFPNHFWPHRERLVWWMAYSIFIPCGCKNCDIMFVEMQDCLPQRFRIAKERRSWKEKLLSVTERLWSKLTGILTFHCQLSSSQIHPRHSWNCWQPSCDWVSVLPSLLHTASITQLSRSSLFPYITSLMQCNLIGPPTFWCVEQEWNRPFTGPFSRVWRKMVWKWD